MIDKKNIRRYVGGVLVATIITGGVIAKGVEVERNVDHVHELCPFVAVLGLEHQAKAINDRYFYKAVYTNNKDEDTRPDTYLYNPYTEEKMPVSGVVGDLPDYINKEGEEVYMIPYPYKADGAIRKGDSDGTETVTVYGYDPGGIMEKTYNFAEKERTFVKDKDGVRVVEQNSSNPDYVPGDTLLGIDLRNSDITVINDDEGKKEETGRTR